MSLPRRPLIFSIAGHADIDQMIRGTQLPPFLAGMTAAQIDISVPIRFSLTR
jgi:hypothetical protein